MLRIPLVSALAAVVLFSSVPVSIRVVGVGPFTIGVVRLGLAALVMTLVVALRGQLKPRQWSWRTWLVLLAIGGAFGLHWLFYFLSVKTANASLGAVGFSTAGAQLTVLGWVLGMSRFHPIEAGGVLLAAVGGLLSFPPEEAGAHLSLGLWFGIASGFFYAFLPILHQRHRQLDFGLRTWAQFSFALPVFLLFLPATDWTATAEDWLLLVYLSLVVTLIGHVLWIHASTGLSTTAISVIAYLYLPIAMTTGWWFLDEVITRSMVLGAACIVAGNLIALWSQLQRGTMEVVSE